MVELAALFRVARASTLRGSKRAGTSRADLLSLVVQFDGALATIFEGQLANAAVPSTGHAYEAGATDQNGGSSPVAVRVAQGAAHGTAVRNELSTCGRDHRDERASLEQRRRVSRSPLVIERGVLPAHHGTQVRRALNARLNKALEDRDDIGADAVARGVVVADEPKKEKYVFGGDDRVIISSPGSFHPYRLIGSMGTSNCTAFKLINDHTAVTAAHCVHSGSAWKTRRPISFGASASSGFPYGSTTSTCYDRTVNGNYDGSSGGHEYDYAIIRLRSNTANCGSNYPLGKFGYQGVSNGTSGINGALAGYASKTDERGEAPPGGWTAPELFFHQKGDGYTNCCGIFNGHVWYYNDESDGQSGGPYWTYDGTSRNVRAIHYGSDHTGNNTNGGVRIKDAVINFFNANAGY
jgi:V8-like Glu-specific endopeptidase